jgi:hypothetical protein
MIQDDEIQQIIVGSSDIRDACRKLIERANDHGGEDNITAVLIRIEDETKPGDKLAPRTDTTPSPPSSTMTGPRMAVDRNATTLDPPPPARNYDIGEDATHPALDLRKELEEMKRLAEDATHPALDLRKDLAEARKLAERMSEDQTQPQLDLRQDIEKALKAQDAEAPTQPVPEVEKKKD